MQEIGEWRERGALAVILMVDVHSHQCYVRGVPLSLLYHCCFVVCSECGAGSLHLPAASAGCSQGPSLVDVEQ